MITSTPFLSSLWGPLRWPPPSEQSSLSYAEKYHKSCVELLAHGYTLQPREEVLLKPIHPYSNFPAYACASRRIVLS